MSEKSRESVLGALPHARTHRRSSKRAARPQAVGDPGPAAERTAGPDGHSAQTHAGAPLDDPVELAATVVKAVVELAEIGLTAGTRALRSAIARLPRP